MAQQKTAISIDDSIYKQMNALAKRLRVSRSGLFELAARQLVASYKDEMITEQLNKVYQNKTDVDDEKFLQQLKKNFRRVAED